MCQYLGYDRASEIYTETLPTLNTRILSVNFNCRGNEGELAECVQKEQKANASYKARVSGVRCIVDGKRMCLNLYAKALGFNKTMCRTVSHGFYVLS